MSNRGDLVLAEDRSPVGGIQGAVRWSNTDEGEVVVQVECRAQTEEEKF